MAGWEGGRLFMPRSSIGGGIVDGTGDAGLLSVSLKCSVFSPSSALIPFT